MFVNELLTYKARNMACMLVLIMLSSYISLSAQFTYVNTGVGGTAWGDYNNDGYLDVLSSGSIYRNNGDCTFTDINAGIGGTAWGDYDNDGYLDILSYNTVYHNNGDSTFTDINAGLVGDGTASWGDYDNDGDLDILHTGGGTKVYRNDGAGIFTDISAALIYVTIGSAVWGDYDNDGDLDILQTGLYVPNVSYYTAQIYRNDGNDTFINIGAGLLGVVNSFATWGDYDNDGDLDIILTGFEWGEYKSIIYRNDGQGIFTNIQAGLMGVDFSSCAWGDYDNDGDLDIILSGFNGGWVNITKLYRNDSNNIFTDTGVEWAGRAPVSWGDYDNDGDLDLSIGSALYRNDISGAPNSDPSFPSISFDNSTGLISLSNSNDNTTPSSGLTYDVSIRNSSDEYFYRPASNLITGFRKAVQRGSCSIFPTDLPPNQTYYLSAQAIDNCYMGSPFSPEISITTPSLHLSYPNGGESLVCGTTSYIRWDFNSVRYLKIKLTTDNGTTWTNLVALPVPSAPGIYYYTVPIANSNQCKIRILWAKDNSYYDDSDQVFTISSSTTEPTIAVTYPTASGINVTPGQPVNITWTSSNLSEVSIDYTTNNGVTWNTIVQNRPAALTPFAWTVPDSLTSQARIRIRKADNANYYDISDNIFTICKVTVLSPNGGELLTGDYSGVATIPITWSAPYVGTVNLFYSTNNGSNWTSIASVSGSLGTYNWTIPALESTSCRVKVSHSSASFISDISNAVFTIRVPVKFINANGGGFVNNNFNYTLRWKIIEVDPATQVHLEYSIDNSTWTRINATAIPVTSLSHTFYMALGEASQVWFRMAETGTNKIIAKSTTSMTVTGKTLHVSTPAIGEGLAVDSYTTITWTADGCTNLDIFYTTDFGTTWLPVATNVPAAQGYQVWLVPNTTSTQCRIKLQDTTYPYMNIESDGEFTILALTLIASFYAIPTSGYSDLTVQFYDQSIGYISAWAWDFQNDGITDSNLQNPTYTYRQSGFYSVKLTVWDGPTSITMTRNNYIYVQPMVADFLASETNGYAPLTVQFTDMTPSDITQWAWDFDNDGITDSDAQNPYWTYLFPGTYTVKLNVTNGLDSDEEIKLAYVSVTLDTTSTLYVPTQFPTIQAAIDASVDGDYIIVSDGTYYENLVIVGKNITIASNYFIDGDTTHVNNTIIDGGQAADPDAGSVITMLPGAGRPITSPHICGFTIRNGTGRRILQNIGGNTVEKRVGGGIYINQTNPMFTQNKVIDNDADDEGGGSYAFQSLPNLGGTVSVGVVNPGGNTFLRNYADIGKDLYVYGNTARDVIQIRNCDFEVFNQADSTLSNYWATSAAPLSFEGSSGSQNVITSDIYVSTDGNDTINTGISAASPFKTIDHALSRAYGTITNPVTIHIAPGIYSPNYTGERFPLQMVNWVSLQGAGTDETIIDAEANAEYPSRVIACDKTLGVSISNLTITGGYVTTVKNYHGGGIGVTDSQLSINHSLLTNNSSAGDGAGLYLLNSTATIDSVSFDTNSALGSGGGTFSSASILNLVNSTYSMNTCNKNGAGVFADNGQVQIEACNFQNNQANGSLSNGGGISISSTTNANINSNLLKSNNAKYGAGIYSQANTNLTIDRNRIINNLAATQGGGLFCNSTTGNVTNNLIANNTASQRGGGIYTYAAINLTNNTIANNRATTQGGGIYLNAASPTLRNTILWGNTSGSGNQVYLSGAAVPAFYYSDVQGGGTAFAGTVFSGIYQNNLNISPLFTAPTTGAGSSYNALNADFSLQETSPCINTGDPGTNISQMLFDLAGYSRLSGDYIDMGAYEHQFMINLDAPQNVSIDIANGQLNLHWDRVLGANSYRIFTSDLPFGAFTDELLMSSGVLALNGNRYTWTTPFAGFPKKFYQVKASSAVIRESEANLLCPESVIRRKP